MLQPGIWILPNFFQGVCELVHTGSASLRTSSMWKAVPLLMSGH